MATIHPQTQEIIDYLRREYGNNPPVCELSPEKARRSMVEFFQYWNADAPPVAKSIERTIEGPHGPIPIRIYDPGSAAPSPGIVFFHGGGFVLGNIASHDGLSRRLANYSGCRIVSVDYRLAPEHKFPIPLDDCVAATRWVGQHGLEIGIDPSRLFVGGESAGANLSLATTIVLRDEGGAELAGAVLIYGCYDTDFDTPSYQSFGGGEYLLSRQNMVWFWEHYLNGPGDRENPKAIPLRAKLSGLPPLLVLAAELDPLLDDSVRLAGRLRAANAPHDWVLWRGVIHGCVLMTRMLGPANVFLHDIAAWVNRQARSVAIGKGQP